MLVPSHADAHKSNSPRLDLKNAKEIKIVSCSFHRFERPTAAIESRDLVTDGDLDYSSYSYILLIPTSYH